MYEVPTLGLNYRMSDINAALGRQQLGRIDEILERRRAHFLRLKAALDEVDNIQVLDAQNDDTRSSHYCLSVVLAGALKGRRPEVMARLKEAGVGTSVYYPQPVPRMAYYRDRYGYQADAYPRAANISDESIALPVGPHLSVDDVDYIAVTFAEVVKELKS
jgi:dTDP-4-amino-4,6-dideoxygalactose transaminase